MTDTVKYCEDCKHFERFKVNPERSDLAHCTRLDSPSLIVKGFIDKSNLFCGIDRNNPLGCGFDAKFFEQKE